VYSEVPLARTVDDTESFKSTNIAHFTYFPLFFNISISILEDLGKVIFSVSRETVIQF
jgi:hypothetical protein